MPEIFETVVSDFCAAGIVLFVLAWREDEPYRKAEQEQLALKTAVVSENSKTGKKEKSDPLARQIDFTALQKMNPDIAAWLYVPGTEIDDPVLIGKNDSEYLKKNFRGKQDVLGSVFAFADTDPGLSEAHLCLFGHNTNSSRMFGELKNINEIHLQRHTGNCICTHRMERRSMNCFLHMNVRKQIKLFYIRWKRRVRSCLFFWNECRVKTD